MIQYNKKSSKNDDILTIRMTFEKININIRTTILQNDKWIKPINTQKIFLVTELPDHSSRGHWPGGSATSRSRGTVRKWSPQNRVLILSGKSMTATHLSVVTTFCLVMCLSWFLLLDLLLGFVSDCCFDVSECLTSQSHTCNHSSVLDLSLSPARTESETWHSLNIWYSTIQWRL